MSIQQKLVGVLLVCFLMGSIGCSSNQTLKNAWKGTRSVWYSTVNVPATIDYDETGSLEEYQMQLAKSMVGVDSQLIALEKTMSNADKPPTEQWTRALFTRFPWLDGFTGARADGTMIGQVPGPPVKSLDFHPLLVEDPKHPRRSVRGYVQDTPMGPEVFLATPLYDTQEFIGIVAVYFDMRAVLRYSEAPDDMVIISPNAILWPGKYNFASTPMAGIAWDKITLEANSGTVTNASGTFYWSMRYFGNIPLIFGVPVKGSFGDTPASRTGPTSEGPYAEVKPLKMPPAPPKVDVPPAPPAPRRVVRRVVRKPLPMPIMPPMPVVPAPEPVRMPSPLHPAPSSDAAKSPEGQSTSPATPAPSGNDAAGTAQEAVKPEVPATEAKENPIAPAVEPDAAPEVPKAPDAAAAPQKDAAPTGGATNFSPIGPK